MSTPEEIAAAEAAKNDRPEWLPEQFQTPEALAKSYEESRKEMDRLRSQNDEERAQFAAALEQMAAAQPPVQQQSGLDAQTSATLAQYQQAVESGDAATQLAISLALNKQLMEQSLDERFKTLEPKLGEQAQADRNIAFQIAQDRVAKQYGDDWDKLAPDVDSWLREHQSWLPTANDPAAFEQVIREGATSIVNQKAAEQLAALEAERATKLAAQTANGSGQGRYPLATDDKANAWKEIAGADLTSYGQARAGRG